VSFRKQQVESTLKRAISTVLATRIADPRIEGMVTVTKVDVSPDMHQAQVFVSVLPESHEKTTLAGLRSASGHINGLIRKSITMKVMPRLEFRLDESIKKEAAVLDAIRRGRELEDKRAAERGETPAEPPTEEPSKEDHPT
jgi:ribosome-binding factor A